MTTPSYGQLQAAAIALEDMPRVLARQLKTFPPESQDHARLSHARALLLAALDSIRKDMAAIE